MTDELKRKELEVIRQWMGTIAGTDIIGTDEEALRYIDDPKHAEWLGRTLPIATAELLHRFALSGEAVNIAIRAGEAKPCLCLTNPNSLDPMNRACQHCAGWGVMLPTGNCRPLTMQAPTRPRR